MRNKRTVKYSVIAVLTLNLVLTAQAQLTHRYSFNDGTANDLVGGANGTLINGASVSGGKLVLNNNGVNNNPATGQYVSLPNNILKNRNFTLETWFTFNGGNDWQRLIDLGNTGTDFLMLAVDGLGRPQGEIYINGVGQDLALSNVQFPIGGEHCLAYIHNTDFGYQQLYLDGVSIGTSSAQIAGDTANFSNFYLGRSQYAVDPFYNGSIDELRTYNVALTLSQIQSEYAAGPDVLTVPEPSGCLLLALSGFLGLARRLRRARR
jgi:hypothetical protein